MHRSLRFHPSRCRVCSLVVDWQEEYKAAKVLSVRVVAGCGRDDLARSLADEHEHSDGTIALCHEAELRQVGYPETGPHGGRILAVYSNQIAHGMLCSTTMHYHPKSYVCHVACLEAFLLASVGTPRGALI